MAIFDTLELWRDDQPRTGEENMAVDQLLTESIGGNPVLRVYDWSEPTVSFGYFLAFDDARKAFPSTDDQPVNYVRRWTGGGIVDHRNDLTYTLVIPRSHTLSMTKGAESYRQVHQALANTLNELGESVRLTATDEGAGGVTCFTNPVAYDLTNQHGEKIAGAGQRRSRYGLLHQGSLVAGVSPDLLAPALGRHLAQRVNPWCPELSLGPDFFKEAVELAAKRYASDAWLTKK